MLKMLIYSTQAEIKEKKQQLEEAMIEVSQEFNQEEDINMFEFLKSHSDQLFYPLFEVYLKEKELELLKENCTSEFLREIEKSEYFYIKPLPQKLEAVQ